MNYWSDHSKRELQTVHADLVTLFTIVLQIWDCKISEGHRAQAEQDLAFLQGHSKIKWPDGNHNKLPSMAVDVLPFVEGKFIGWTGDHATKQWFAFAGLVKGVAAMLLSQGLMTHSIRWGGDWDSDWNFKDQSFNDWPHFELII